MIQAVHAPFGSTVKPGDWWCVQWLPDDPPRQMNREYRALNKTYDHEDEFFWTGPTAEEGYNWSMQADHAHHMIRREDAKALAEGLRELWRGFRCAEEWHDRTRERRIT